MAADPPPVEERPAKLQCPSVDECLRGTSEDAQMSDGSEKYDLPDAPEDDEMSEDISAGEPVQVCIAPARCRHSQKQHLLILNGLKAGH